MFSSTLEKSVLFGACLRDAPDKELDIMLLRNTMMAFLGIIGFNRSVCRSINKSCSQ